MQQQEITQIKEHDILACMSSSYCHFTTFKNFTNRSLNLINNHKLCELDRNKSFKKKKGVIQAVDQKTT